MIFKMQISDLVYSGFSLNSYLNQEPGYFDDKKLKQFQKYFF